MLNPKHAITTSKRMSQALRHSPETLGITLGSAGWTPVADLLAGLVIVEPQLCMDDLKQIVAADTKKRFEFSGDGLLIRASQGHSVEVDLQYEPTQPPEILYHGTMIHSLESIRSTGLAEMNRHHVHLSTDTTTAAKVGARRGMPVVFIVKASAMASAGHVFFRTTNGVWLTDHVPPEFIEFP